MENIHAKSSTWKKEESTELKKISRGKIYTTFIANIFWGFFIMCLGAFGQGDGGVRVFNFIGFYFYFAAVASVTLIFFYNKGYLPVKWLIYVFNASTTIFALFLIGCIRRFFFM